MAGYFNPDALDDPEVMDGLSDDAHRAWIVACLERHPRCGIFKLNLRLWSARCRTPLDAMPACLEAYERLGWIKRDGEYVWIVSYTKHQSKQKDWLQAAREEALDLREATPLADLWLEHYAEIRPDSQDGRAKYNLKSLAKSPLISIPKSIPKSIPSDSITDRQTEIQPEAEPSGPQTLQSLEASLPPECLDSWKAFRAMVDGKRKYGAKESVHTGLLLEIKTKTLDRGYSPAALNYGLAAAIRKAADNPNYVATAAKGRHEELTRGEVPEPHQPSLREIIDGNKSLDIPEAAR